MKHVFTSAVAAIAVALVLGAPARSAGQDLTVPGFTKESFALLKQRAEAGDQKAKELLQNILASTRAFDGAVSNYVNALGALEAVKTQKTEVSTGSEEVSGYTNALGALERAKAEIQKEEASTGILTASMLMDAADSFVVNGFFVGMPLADAQARLARLLPGKKVSRRPPGGTLSEAARRGLEGLWIDESNEAFCLAENGRVVRLLIPGPLVVDWLGLQSSSYGGRAEEIARKFGCVDIYGIPIVEIMVFYIPGIGGIASVQVTEYLAYCSIVEEKEFEKSGYGKGHALQFNQRLYRLGKEGRVTYFGKASGSSDIGATKQGRNPFFDGWLKNLRALGENASEGTLRIDAKDFKMPD